MAGGELGAAAVVGVDVVDLGAARRPADDDERDAPGGQLGGQRIVAVEADEDDAVDVAAGQVAHGARLLLRVVGHEQDELQVARGEGRADAADDAREERIAEQAGRPAR